MVACASTLHVKGIEINEAKDAALALKPLDMGPDREPPRRDNRRSNLERALGDLVRKGVLFREGGDVSTSPIAADEPGEV